MDVERKILCVEDSLEQCEVIAELIHRSGLPYSVRSVHNTEDALDLIAVEHFDVYILDTWVPEIGGLQLTKKIREKDPDTPIVFFTAITSGANKKKALAAGANEFLRKADDIHQLVPAVKRLLEDSESVSA